MTYDVRRYLSVRSAYGASWGPEGDRLAFLMDVTGVPQVWTVDGRQRWPVQRTAFEERVTFVDWSPTREELVFGMDQGGNERTQLHLLDLADGSIENLTSAPDAKHRWGGWSTDGDRFAFASNRRDEAVFDLYVQDREERGDEATRVAEGDGWLSLAGWSPDDERLLVHEARSSFDHDLHVLDLASGDLRRVTEDEGDVRYGSPEWAPDGEGIYLATDAEADTTRLALLDPEAHHLETVREGGDWDVANVNVHEETGRIAYARNVDGYSEVTVGVLDAPTIVGEDARPDLPAGDAHGIEFDPSGERFALTVSGRQHNANVWVGSSEPTDDGAVATSSAPDGRTAARLTCEHWTDAPTAGIPRETFRAPELIHYESEGRREAADRETGAVLPERYRRDDGEEPETVEVPAYFTLPAGAAGEETHAEVGGGSRTSPGAESGAAGVGTHARADEQEPAAVEGQVPAIVDVHGGPESQRRSSFSASAQFFLAQGYAVLEPNVRGSTGYGREYTHLDDVEKRMDAVADLRAAHEWLAAHPAVDADRVAIKGGSYGGFMVLAAMTEYPDLWAAGIDVVGIANFVTFLENTGEWRRDLREAEYGSLADDRDLLEAISPIHRVDAVEAPLFVAHGANDPRVPVGEAEQIAAAAREQGVPVELLVFDDEGHGFSKLENRLEAYRRYAAFLDEHV